MGCNTCHRSCEDCSEGGISFKRQLRSAASAPKPATQAVTDLARPPLRPDQLRLAQLKVSQAQRSAS